jgi:biotin carboxyl carrier protein
LGNKKEGLINMNFIKIRFIKVFFLLSLQGFISPTICFSELPDFLDDSDPHRMVLQRDIKVPLGFKGNVVQYVVLPTGTPLIEIAPKISQKREEIDLSPHIPLDQQDAFFQDYLWQTKKDHIETTSMPGKIIQLFVRKGQHVEKGERLCVIEAMKIQITVLSSYAGEVKNISVEENTVANAGSTLMSLLPTSPNWEDINQEQILQNKDFLLSFFPWALIEFLQEEPVQSLSLPLMENSFSELIEDEVILEEKVPDSLIPLLDPILLPVSTEQESESSIPMNEVSSLTPQVSGNEPEELILESVSPLSSMIEFVEKADNLSKTESPEVIQNILEEGVLEAQAPTSLPIFLLDPILLPVSTEQESEPLIPVKNDTPLPQDELATSPTRGEVSLIQESFLSTPSEASSKETSYTSLDSPLPLWERSPLAAGEGILSKDGLNALSLNEVSSLTPPVSVNECEGLTLESVSLSSPVIELVEKADNLSETESPEAIQNILEEGVLEAQSPTALPTLLLDPILPPVATEQESEPSILMNEVSSLTPQISVNKLKRSILEQLPLPSPMAKFVDMENAEWISAGGKSRSKPRPFVIKKVFARPMKRGIISTSLEISIDAHNCPKLKPVEKTSFLRGSLKTVSIPSKTEDDGRLLRTAAKQLQLDRSLGLNAEFRKRSIDEYTYSLQERSSLLKAKLALRENSACTIDNKTNFHMPMWIKYICGLIVLCKLIFANARKFILLAMVTISKYSTFFFFQKLLFLNATYFNTHRFIINQVTSNRNHGREIRKRAA